MIAQNDNMVALNAAIEVDLTGQVCSDSIGPAPFSGIGGQVDFLRGAARSKGGLPIIALPSTAKNGTVSRIVPFLRPGAGVVTSRGDVHYVITEHGVAYLHGKTVRQRAEALIQVAEPKFRDELVRDGIKARLLTASRLDGSCVSLPAAQPHEEDAQQDQRQPHELLAREGLLEEQAGPDQRPDVAQRNHGIEHGKLPVADPHHEEVRGTQ